MGVCHNITDRKRAERALEESEKRFRAIFDQAPLGIALLDSHSGPFVQINRSYCEIAGRTQEEMLTLDFQSITHPETLQADLDNTARVDRRARFVPSVPRSDTCAGRLHGLDRPDRRGTVGRGQRPRFHSPWCRTSPSANGPKRR